MKRLNTTRLIFIFTTLSFWGILWFTMEHTIPINNFAIKTFMKNVDLRLIVIVYNRAESVLKCLITLNNADYLGDNVHVDVWIDRSPDGIIDEKTYKTVLNFKFLHGTYQIHNHTKHVGLYGQWLQTWHPTEDSKEIGVILEDDVNVSPFFYRYLKAVHKKYDSYSEINGYALQGISIKHAGDPGRLKAPVGNSIFLYPVLGTWGFSPKVKNWISFLKWFKTASLKEDFKPLVPKILPTRWYMGYKGKGPNPKIWSMWHIYYAYKNKELTVYSNSINGKGFTVGRKENGLHYNGPARTYVDPVVSTWNNSYIMFPDQPVILDIHGNMVSDRQMAWGIHSK